MVCRPEVPTIGRCKAAEHALAVVGTSLSATGCWHTTAEMMASGVRSAAHPQRQAVTVTFWPVGCGGVRQRQAGSGMALAGRG